MLTDAEITQCRKSEEYNAIMQSGLKQVVSDLVRLGQGELKPELSPLVRIAYGLLRAWVIRQELCASSSDLLERILNLELEWARTPNSVCNICQEQSNNYMWMRFDVARVEALFGRCVSLMTDARFRNLIKDYSSIREDKNKRLLEILKEIETLQILSTRSISTKGLFDGIVKLRADEYYRDKEEEIQRKFLDSSKNGALGFLPKESGERNNE